jgi:endonuclease G
MTNKQIKRDLQRKLVNALIELPVAETFQGRTSLMSGLPRMTISRSQDIARLDLDQMVSQLAQLGRIESGIRPLIVVAENALDYVDEWQSDLYKDFVEIKRELEQHYGGEVQIKSLPPIEPERLLFKGQDERLPFNFLEQAIETGRSIGRFRVPRFFGNKHIEGDDSFGTGWIIAPRIMITNHHVVEARDLRFEKQATAEEFQLQAENTVVWFDYQREGGEYNECHNAELLASDRKLDYAVVRLKESEKIAERKPLHLINENRKLYRGKRLNIVQHSGGGPLLYAIRNNFYIGEGNTHEFLRYLTDTQSGASGSPVFDDFWRVVGLHHASVPIPSEYYVNLPRERFETLPEETVKGEIITYHNEGIDIHAIMRELPEDLRQQILSAQA